METEESQYIKAFNNGYVLAKFEPTLLATILKNLSPSNSYLEGMFAGKEEFELEKFRPHIDELNQIRQKGKDRENDLERE